MRLTKIFSGLVRAFALLFVSAGVGGLLMVSAGENMNGARGTLGAGFVLVTVSLMIALVPVLFVIGARLGWKRYRHEVIGIEEGRTELQDRVASLHDEERHR
jgi:hypothetical protein